MATKPATKKTPAKSAAPAAKNPTLTTDEDKVRAYIKERILAKYGTYAAYAEAASAQRSHISGFLNGDRPVPAWALEHFKIVKRTVFALPAA